MYNYHTHPLLIHLGSPRLVRLVLTLCGFVQTYIHITSTFFSRRRLGTFLSRLYKSAAPADYIRNRTPCLLTSIIYHGRVRRVILSFEQQPLDTLRIELENEPAFGEQHAEGRSYINVRPPIHIIFLPTLSGSLTRLAQALLEGSGVQCIPGEANGPRLRLLATDCGGRRHRRALPAYRPIRCTSPACPNSDSFHTFRNYPDWQRVSNSSHGAKRSSRAGQWASTRCATCPSIFLLHRHPRAQRVFGRLIG
jgi:hypothetical protein